MVESEDGLVQGEHRLYKILNINVVFQRKILLLNVMKNKTISIF